MKTLILSTDDKDLKLAAEKIRSGEVVAFPTETVYGLGANALDENAVKKIFEAKGRPADNPLIVHISDISMMDDIAAKVPDTAYKLAEKFWPGPLTVILPKSDKIPDITSGGLDTVGIRFPSNPYAQKFISYCGLPIAAPSANLSGSPSPTTALRVFQDMDGRIPVIIDGGESEFGVESTVISIDGSDGHETVRILRPGAVTKEMLLEVTDRVVIDNGVLNELPKNQKALSPGMKYKHYSPKAEVTIVRGTPEDFAEYVINNPKDGLFCLLFDESCAVSDIPYVTYGSDSKTQAHRLFEALRQLDELGAKYVYAQCPEADGIGLAVYNRILRAAGFKMVDAGKHITVIGLTGQSGAGKSTAARMFESCGFPVIDCDEVSRRVSTFPEFLSEIDRVFPGYTDENGLKRREFGALVFNDHEKLRAYGEIIFPLIKEEIFREIDDLSRSGHGFVILDAPTLFESGMDKICSAVVSVIAPLDEKIKRILERDGIPVELAQSRLSSQYSEQFFRERSDWVIVNGSGIDDLEKNVKSIVESIRKRFND